MEKFKADNTCFKKIKSKINIHVQMHNFNKYMYNIRTQGFNKIFSCENIKKKKTKNPLWNCSL